MLNKKKGLAMLLAATMVVGSAFPVLAAESNSGSTTGAGTSEGHVEKKATKVVLPVETTDYSTSTFAYTMDPEGLIAETDGGKYADGTTFPDEADDTGVYFLTAEKTYENNSKALKVENQSSHSIDLTVKAEVENPATTDIPLVAENALAGATDASLYLGLVVGSETPEAITTTSAAEIEVTLPGNADNFKVAAKADKSGYEYRVLTLDEYKALDAANASATELPWQKTTFNLEGATTTDKAITDTTTAPQVKVTWSWTDPTGAVEPSISGAVADENGVDWDYTADFTKGTNLVFTVDFGTEATAISSALMGSTLDGVATAPSLSVSENVVTIAGTAWGASVAGDTRYCKITLDDGSEFVIKITIRVA